MLLMLLLLLPSGCRREAATMPERITIGVAHGPYALLVWLAQEEGFFDRHHLQVEIREYDSGAIALNDLGPQLDLVITPEYPFVLQTDRRPELRILATVATSDIHALVARRDRGINSVIDLRGRTIGVTAGTAAEFFLGNFLALERDVSWNNVQIRDLPARELLEAVTQGTLEAAVLGGEEVFELQQRLGEQAIAWPAQWGLKSYWCLVTDEQWLAEKEAASRALLAALIAAEEELARRPELVERVLSSTAQLQPMLQGLRFRITLDQALLLSMEEEAEWLRLTPQPNFLQQIALEPLLLVSPQRVKLFR
jgi:ABC-type nitrate/sulfonate/bicarbonate transport system substrate-binding protein